MSPSLKSRHCDSLAHHAGSDVGWRTSECWRNASELWRQAFDAMALVETEETNRCRRSLLLMSKLKRVTRHRLATLKEEGRGCRLGRWWQCLMSKPRRKNIGAAGCGRSRGQIFEGSWWSERDGRWWEKLSGVGGCQRCMGCAWAWSHNWENKRNRKETELRVAC